MRVAVLDVRAVDAHASALFTRAVDPSRRARAERFVKEIDRRRCVAAGMLLRHSLSVHHGIAPEDQRLTLHPRGKPRLSDPGGPAFNLSHGGDWVVCATSDEEVGVDVERCDAGSPTIVDRFAASEQHYVMSAWADDRHSRFTQVWTLKESYLKYVGEGLHRSLGSFSVVDADGRLAGDVQSAHGLTLHLVRLGAAADHWLATCSTDEAEPEVTELSVAALADAC